MKKTQQTFNDGDVIFREGEPSDAAYEIVSGNVEIAKTGDGGTVRLGVLGPGQMFGEMGVLDQGKRSATAKAKGAVTVNAISRKEFLTTVRDRPEVALTIMGQMAERLRGADEMLAGGPGAEVPDSDARPQHVPRADTALDGAGAAAAGLLGRLFSWKGVARPERIDIRVAPVFAEDGGDKLTQRVQKALEKRKGMRVRALKKPLAVDPEADLFDRIPAAEAEARKALAEAEADLLIWGEVPTPGLTMHLRFVSFASWEDDQAGSFGAGAVLPLSVEFGDESADYIHAMALAATVPKSEAKAAALTRDLPLALDSARFALDALHGDLTKRERGLVHTCYANALTTVAVQRNDAGIFRLAAEAFQECLKFLAENETPREWAVVQKQLGLVLQAIAERTDGEDTLGAAADAFRGALRVLNKDDDPRAWAAVHNRLGEVLFRLDFESGDTEMLKHALAAYQSALQVYTRGDYPLRWAEVMNNFAQVTQVLGEQLQSAEALEKAAQACRAALEVRTKARVPLLWAATQNNLGSALFLLGKMTKNVTHLQGAAEAFDLAGGVYKARAMDRMSAVTDKNLDHVKELLTRSQPKDRSTPPADGGAGI